MDGWMDQSTSLSSLFMPGIAFNYAGYSFWVEAKIFRVHRLSYLTYLIDGPMSYLIPDELHSI